MSSLLETIVERKQMHGGITLSAAEVEHLVLTTVETALEMACNAIDNCTAGTFSAKSAAKVIDTAQIIAQLKENFTSMVQQYWPAPVQIGSARTEPYMSHDDDMEDLQALMDRDRE